MTLVSEDNREFTLKKREKSLRFSSLQGSGPRLVGFSTLFRGKVFTLQSPNSEPILFGSANSCDHTIFGSTMHEYHAAFQITDGNWVVSKVDTKASIWVNGEPVSFALLEERDLVKIGRHEFILML